MSVLDKFINAMKLNDDYDGFDDDFLDDDMDDYEEERPRKPFFKRNNNNATNTFDEPKAKSTSQPKSKPKTTPSKISAIRPRKGSAGMEVCVIKPISMEDAREITETLLANCTIVLNMEGLDLDIAQRIFDFASGSCFALSGNLQKISQYIFIITPAAVDISGDFQDILNGSFDVSSGRNTF